eukprot:GFUD01044841.1.p1 GENE.GFUD01044841.1~~GFUD01044841.1.p1  ORF type:complete len:595 (+),score=173.71 GFUD01044841.1:159-1943(+)
MDRTRSVSESQSLPTYHLKKSQDNSPPGTAGSISASSSLSSLQSVPNKARKDFAKYSLSKVLADYTFLGNIVTFKPQEAYGFIRSEQVTGDVFFSLNHMDSTDKASCTTGALGRWVNFVIKDCGKKSMEARRVSLVPSSTTVSYLSGRVMNWAKIGCFIQVTSGLGLQHLHNRLFAPLVETDEFVIGEVGIGVTFKVHVDRSFRLEGRDVKRGENNDEVSKEKDNAKVRKARRRAVTEGSIVGNEEDEGATEGEKLMSLKHITNEEFSDELVIAVESMDACDLSALFDKQLKTRLSTLAQQPVGSKVVVAVIKRAARLEGINVEEKITRMVMANFKIICSTKQGCAVVQAGLENFYPANKVMLAEQLLELDTVEEFSVLWVHGSHIFSMMLGSLDENSLAMVGFSLSGHYANLSSHIRHYKPVRALLVSLVNTDSFNEILPEVEQELVSLACNKFGHFIISALIESSPSTIKSRLISAFTSKIATLSIHQVCHTVIVTALEQGTASTQAAFIEEVCTVSTNQADMAVIKLTKDKYGHVVVLAMLKVSRHKQVHNVLKASILCKQDELIENEFAAKVMKTIKTEFHNRTSGNYSK